MRSSVIVALVPLLSLGLLPEAKSSELSSFITVDGLVESRLSWNDGPRSWEHRGLGKISFGGDGGARGSAHAEAAAEVGVDLGSALRANFSISLDPRRHGNPADVLEAFLLYESGAAHRTRAHAKVGAFFPPVSFENDGLAWTSPFTLTSSAINTWIGLEMRTLGVEVGVSHQLDWAQVSISGAVFGANDPAGVLLAWHGWAVSDREAGIFERLPLAPLPVFSATGPVPQQAPWFELRHEIDRRPGAYLGLELSAVDVGALNLLLYDNRARDTAFDGFQYAWHTRFAAVGTQFFAADNIEVIAQGMVGDTTMGEPSPGMSLVNTGFASAFVLATQRWGRHRVSARAEYFETTDRDRTAVDNNGEHGTSITAAYSFRPRQSDRLTFEVLQIISFRPERAHLNLPIKARESQAQLSYRVFF
ncbi:MAG: hypothetical protein AB7I36_16835 [Rhodospirillaceae bacterium]